jgi:hypothetical protein
MSRRKFPVAPHLAKRPAPSPVPNAEDLDAPNWASRSYVLTFATHERVIGWRGYSLRQRENMAKEVATKLKARYRLRATYFSVLGKRDPDRLPTFYGVMEDPLYFNY